LFGWPFSYPVAPAAIPSDFRKIQVKVWFKIAIASSGERSSFLAISARERVPVLLVEEVNCRKQFAEFSAHVTLVCLGYVPKGKDFAVLVLYHVPPVFFKPSFALVENRFFRTLEVLREGLRLSKILPYVLCSHLCPMLLEVATN